MRSGWFSRLDRALSPAVVLGVIWAAFLLYAYPGQMTVDSFDHLHEARTGFYTDAHPPFLNVLFKVCDSIVTGPLLLLLIESGLAIFGLYFVLKRRFAPREAAWLTGAIFLAPPVILPFGFIWKDGLMAGGMLMGLAGMLSPSRPKKIGGLVCIFFATAVRYNAFAGTFGLVVFAFEWWPGARWYKRYALSLAVWLVVTLAAFRVNSAITDRQMHYWHTSLALYDIAGTLTYVDEDLSDERVLELCAGTDLQITKNIQSEMRSMYSTRDFFSLVADPNHRLWNVPLAGTEPPPPAQVDAIEAAWKRIVFQWPRAYMKHRVSVLAKVLAFKNTTITGLVMRRGMHPDLRAKAGLTFEAWHFQKRLTNGFIWMSEHMLFLFRPWAYLLLAIGLLLMSFRHSDALALLMSAIGIESTLVFLAPSTDYRYSHWMIMATIMAFVILLALRLRGTRAEPAV